MITLIVALIFAGSCHVSGSGQLVMPDSRCTPGATNPAVTQASIHRTICRKGWTATVRPSESVTEPQKRASIAAYGYYAGRSTRVYEYDHLIPLELGGATDDQRNLWPEYDHGRIPNPKDAVERAANRAVCSGRMPLAQAQHAMAANWIAFGRQLRVRLT